MAAKIQNSFGIVSATDQPRDISYRFQSEESVESLGRSWTLTPFVNEDALCAGSLRCCLSRELDVFCQKVQATGIDRVYLACRS
jgi:hypothetical protein